MGSGERDECAPERASAVFSALLYVRGQDTTADGSSRVTWNVVPCGKTEVLLTEEWGVGSWGLNDCGWFG